MHNRIAFTLKEYFLFYLGFIIFLILAFKQGGDPDYLSYIDIYTSSLNSSYVDIRIEPFYYLINYAFVSLGIDFQVLLVIIAFLLVPAKIIFIKDYSPNFLLSIWIYICIIFILYDFIAIRQGIAFSFILLSYYSIVQRNFKKYFFMIFIASLFHFSAIILLLIYPIVIRQYRTIFLYLALSIIFCLNFFQIQIGLATLILENIGLPAFTLEKLNAYSIAEDTSFLSIKQLFIGVLFVSMYKYLKDFKPHILPMVNIYILGMILSTLLSDIGQISYRLRWYFFIYEIVLIPIFLYYLFYKFKSIFMYVCIVCVFAIIYGFSLYMFVFSLYERGYSLYFIEGFLSVF